MKRTPAIKPTATRGMSLTRKLPSSTIRVGIVIDVDPGTKVASVMLDNYESGSVVKSVPWLSQVAFPLNSGGYHAYPMRGTQVVLVMPDNYSAIIIGCFGEAIKPEVFEETLKKYKYEDSFPDYPTAPEPGYSGYRSEVYDVPTQQFPNSHASSAPKDLHLGDQEIASPTGEKIGIYRGGLIRLMTSHINQILMFGFRSLIRVVTRRFSLWTDHGKLDITSENDEVSLDYKAASPFKDESHPSQEKWRARFHTGAGDNIISTHVTEPLADVDGKNPEGLDELSLYNSLIKPTGDKSEYSKENILTVAEKDILEESRTANIKEKAGGSIESKALLNIVHKSGLSIQNDAAINLENKAGANIQFVAGASLTTQASMQIHNTSAIHAINAGNILNLAGGVITSMVSPIVSVTGAFTAIGPAIMLAPIGSSPSPTLNGLQMMTIFNAHTHSVPEHAGISSPPLLQITPGQLTASLIG